jgi:hypothetical protein
LLRRQPRVEIGQRPELASQFRPLSTMPVLHFREGDRLSRGDSTAPRVQLLASGNPRTDAQCSLAFRAMRRDERLLIGFDARCSSASAASWIVLRWGDDSVPAWPSVVTWLLLALQLDKPHRRTRRRFGLIARPDIITSIGMRDWAHVGQSL